MHCFITKINQSYSLDGNDDMAMSAIIELPGGTKIEVPLSEAQVNELIAAKANDPGLEKAQDISWQEEELVEPKPLAFEVDSRYEGDPQTQPVAPDPELQEMFQPQQEGEEENQGPPVKWAELPEGLLKPEVKQVFADMKVQPILPANVLAGLVESVEKRLDAEAAPKQQRKRVGRVIPASTPRRTVPVDEHGYPVVASQVPMSTDYDPGEVADLDEDGVAQM